MSTAHAVSPSPLFDGPRQHRPSIDAYEIAYYNYESIYENAAQLKAGLESNVRRLGEETRTAVNILRAAHRFLQDMTHHLPASLTPHVARPTPFHGLSKAQTVLAQYETALAIGQRANVSDVDVIGSWSLVTLLGAIASDPTQPGLLAANAPLAWLGGSTLGTSKSGLAGGSLLLGGVLLFPKLSLTTGSDSPAEEQHRVEDAIEDVQQTIQKIHEYQALVTQQRARLAQAQGQLKAELDLTRRTLLPHGIASRTRRHAQRIVGQGFIERNERHVLMNLDREVERFTACFGPAAPPVQRSLVLVCISGMYSGNTFRFPSGALSISLGRAPENDIAVPDDPAISRYHALLDVSNGVCTLYDNDSRNGVRVNGIRITSPICLRPGDTIGIGSTTLQFQLMPV